jgi:hypothetical protein
MQLIHKIILIILMIIFIDDYASAQSSISIDTNFVKNDTANQPSSHTAQDFLWLMGSLSGSLYLNRLDTAYIQDFGDWGYSLKFGGIWHNRILQFDYHSETEEVFPLLTEHRYDYALLYGISNRNSTVFDNLMVGISILNYLSRGDQLTPPSSPTAGDATYQQLTGNVFGLAGLAEFYITPIPYWGIFGMGIYGCLNRGYSYVTLEFSVLELNLPITLK